jgi:hypothetical protein
VVSIFRRICLPAALGSTGITRLRSRSELAARVEVLLACLRYYGGSDCCRAPRGVLSRQLSCVHIAILSRPAATNHRRSLRQRFRVFRVVECTPLRARLRRSLAGSPICVCRIMFICHCGRSGSYRCFPPRLAATRLLQVLSRSTVPTGRGLSPRRIALLRSARVGPARPRRGNTRRRAAAVP